MSPEEKREVFAALRAPKPTQEALDQAHCAIQRLIEVGRRDTGQSRIAANFCFRGGTPKSAAASIWWSCGRWMRRLRKDMVTVFAMLPSGQNYPDSIGYGKEFGELVRRWRPQLGKGSGK